MHLWPCRRHLGASFRRERSASRRVESGARDRRRRKTGANLSGAKGGHDLVEGLKRHLLTHAVGHEDRDRRRAPRLRALASHLAKGLLFRGPRESPPSRPALAGGAGSGSWTIRTNDVSSRFMWVSVGNQIRRICGASL